MPGLAENENGRLFTVRRDLFKWVLACLARSCLKGPRTREGWMVLAACCLSKTSSARFGTSSSIKEE